MAFNGQGKFSRLYSWLTQSNAGLNIDPATMDQDTNDIANALNNCITRDGQGGPTADIPWNGHKITGLAPAQNPGDALSLGGITLAVIKAALGFTPVQQGTGVGQDGGTAAIKIGLSSVAASTKPKLTVGGNDYGTLWSDAGCIFTGSATAWVMKWPNGFTLQGGMVTAAGDQQITFPVVFTTLYGVLTRFLGRSQNPLNILDVNVGTPNTSGFAGGPREISGSGSVTVASGTGWYWIAAGFITP